VLIGTGRTAYPDFRIGLDCLIWPESGIGCLICAQFVPNAADMGQELPPVLIGAGRTASSIGLDCLICAYLRLDCLICTYFRP